MASTVLASRNQTNRGRQPFMGGIPNCSNNQRHLNPNPNQKAKSNKRKHFPNAAINGRPNKHSSQAVDSCGVVVSQAASDGDYGNDFNQGGYESYNVAASSRSEINEVRKKLVSDLERIRKLNDRIQSSDLNSRSSNGNVKKLAGSKREMPFGSSNKDPKRFRQGLENGSGGVEQDDNLLKICRQVLTELMKHKLSWVFNTPVNATELGLRDYHEIIKRPMDLGIVRLKLLKNLYGSPSKFASDVRLVFKNAVVYNPRWDEIRRMADKLLVQFEDLFRPIQAKLATNHQAKKEELSAVDDIQMPERSKRLKTSHPVVPSVSNKQNHPTVSNPIVQSPVRAPSPMHGAEQIKPSATSTRRGMRKPPKPRAKDSDKREMNMEEKQKLALGLQSMPPEKMPQLVQIIRKRNDNLAQEGDEIELDIEPLDTETLWEMDRFLTNWKKLVSKRKRQELLLNSVSAADIDVIQVPMNDDEVDGLIKEKKEAGEEDVDVIKGTKEAGVEDVDMGAEYPESSCQHVIKGKKEEGEVVDIGAEMPESSVGPVIEVEKEAEVEDVDMGAEMPEGSVGHVEIEKDDVDMGDEMIKEKEAAGEDEDVDIGDEMPVSSFAHVEIEKDDVDMGDEMIKEEKEAVEEDVDMGDEVPESSLPHVEIEKDASSSSPSSRSGSGSSRSSGSGSAGRSGSGSSSRSGSGSRDSSSSSRGSESGSSSSGADDAKSD